MRGEAAAVVDPPTIQDAAPWLGEGAHLRMSVHPALGFPLCPFTVWDAGRADNQYSSDAKGGRHSLSDECVAVDLGANAGELSSLEAERIVSWRTEPPFVIATANARMIDATPGRLTYWFWNRDPQPVFTKKLLADAFGLPFDATPWWSGPPEMAGFKTARERVDAGALKVAPYDDGVGATDLAVTQRDLVFDDLKDMWSLPVAPENHPRFQKVWHPMATDLSRRAGSKIDPGADVSAISLLWGSATEAPGSRLWGFATTLPPEYEDASYSDGVRCVAVGAAFAWVGAKGEEFGAGYLKDLVEKAKGDPFAPNLLSALVEVHSGLGTIVADLDKAGIPTIALWTLVPLAPISSPRAAMRMTGNARGWAQRDPERSADTWSAELQRPHDDPAVVLAIARNKEWVNEPGDDPPTWRRPLLPTRPANGLAPSTTVVNRLSADSDAHFEVWAGDQWGRFDGPVAFDVSPPARPVPPTPTVRLDFVAADPRPTGSDPASAGMVSVVAHVGEGANGARPLKAVIATLQNASPSTVELEQLTYGEWVGGATADVTSPGESVVVTATAIAIDDDNVDSRVGTAKPLSVFDPRPVNAVVASHRMLFASARRPDGLSEVDLRFVPPALPVGVHWRVYATDERSVLDATSVCRAERADALLRAPADRARMVALANASVVDAGGGALRLRFAAPGRVESLQVVQVVPVTAAGIESPASDCGALILAMPLLDAPPAPRLIATATRPGVDPAVHLKVSVSLPGPRPTTDVPRSLALRGADGNTKLHARVRRTTAGAPFATAPIRFLDVMLSPEAIEPTETQGWRWSGECTDTIEPAAAWAPVTYWAEVAWPDEPAFKPGTTVLPTAVTPWGDANAPDRRASAWSAPSVAAALAAPGPVPPPPTVAFGAATTTIDVGVTEGHPAAAPWTAVAVNDAGVSAEAHGRGPVLAVMLPPGSTAADRWRVAVTAPDGRSTWTLAVQ
jgi:hypothetical protein